MTQADSSHPVPVAIIGMGCLFPRPTTWRASGPTSATGSTRSPRFRPPTGGPTTTSTPTPRRADRTYARRGGFLTPVDFPPLDFGIAPTTVEATDTTQLLGLLVARQALTTPATAPRSRLRPRPRQRDPRRHRHARAGHPPGRPARPPDLAARPARGRRRRRRRPRTSSAGSPSPTSAGRRTRSPACSATSSPAGSPTASTWAAPTASSTPPAPARWAPCTSPCSSWPPAAATWRSPAGSIRSTTSSCTCASARRRPCRRPATPGRSTPPPTARSWARGWASWC